MEQPDGTLYLCTENQGFGTFTPETGQYEKEQGLPQTENLTVYQLASLGKDRLAGITRKGWFVYDCTQKEYTFNPSFHVCTSIFVDRQKQVWIGLEDGLLLCNTSYRTTKNVSYHGRLGQ